MTGREGMLLRVIAVVVFLYLFGECWYLATKRGFELATASLPLPAATNDSSTLWPTWPTQCPPSPASLAGPSFHPALPTRALSIVVKPENRPPLCRPPTPLFVTFASNACLLKQTVLSYLAEGWPPSQIVVVDNSGAARDNLRGKLTAGHHDFLNYSLLLSTYGVSVYRFAVRQTFAQLQNTLLELARENRWPSFYTSHQDVIVRSSRNRTQGSFFHRVLEHQRHLQEVPERLDRWAFSFFHYDWLSHVNVLAAESIGAWDVLIPWYPTDCDYYSRTRMSGYAIIDHYAGEFYDVSSCLAEADRVLFLPTNSTEGRVLAETLEDMARNKKTIRDGRNTWQGQQSDGVSDDFGPRYKEMVAAGRRNYRRKWGTANCDVSSVRPSERIWWRFWVDRG